MTKYTVYGVTEISIESIDTFIISNYIKFTYEYNLICINLNMN